MAEEHVPSELASAAADKTRRRREHIAEELKNRRRTMVPGLALLGLLVIGAMGIGQGFWPARYNAVEVEHGQCL